MTKKTQLIAISRKVQELTASLSDAESIAVFVGMDHRPNPLIDPKDSMTAELKETEQWGCNPFNTASASTREQSRDLVLRLVRGILNRELAGTDMELAVIMEGLTSSRVHVNHEPQEADDAWKSREKPFMDSKI